MALNEDDDFVADRNSNVDRDWINNLEETLQWCTETWGLTVGVQLESGLSGYVVDALMNDGSRAVVKVRRPDAKMRREADALAAFDGAKMVRLLARDDKQGAILLERADPGVQLAAYVDEVDADAIMFDLVKTWEGLPAPASARDLRNQAESWADSLDEFCRLGLEAPLPASRVQHAADQLRTLASTQTGPPQLLHGDLHVGDVLTGTREQWLAIDPKGFVGEALFELAWWMRDPPLRCETVDAMEGPLRARMDAITGNGVDRRRCLDWARACATVLVVARSCAMSAWDAKRHAMCVEALYRL